MQNFWKNWEVIPVRHTSAICIKKFLEELYEIVVFYMEVFNALDELVTQPKNCCGLRFAHCERKRRVNVLALYECTFEVACQNILSCFCRTASCCKPYRLPLDRL